MSVSHYRLSRIEQKVGINSTKLFVFSAPRSLGCDKAGFGESDFVRLVGRERLREDLVIVLAKFYDPTDPNSKNRTAFGSLASEVVLMSAAELRDENG